MLLKETEKLSIEILKRQSDCTYLRLQNESRGDFGARPDGDVQVPSADAELSVDISAPSLSVPEVDLNLNGPKTTGDVELPCTELMQVETEATGGEVGVEVEFPQATAVTNVEVPSADAAV
ncbi:neuroblast differentiation-associated protein AHNAK isoform X2 [Anolis carolinensis]|nr:PREDICTED: neuroblast differentiation-associated protein AHNAK isoform X2 [Anolis carolinensis]|eukprot:XP_008110957.1 PREDICTED: neuroblast differentiation-associated protein AHNAK isoform X2 [Anolis carolinensis]